MDQRAQEQKILKKQCRRCKRANVALMRTLCLLSLLLTAVALTLAFGMYSIYPFDFQGVLSVVDLVGYEWFIVGFFGLLFFMFAIGWGQGKVRYRKSREYLDYQTLKNTLEAEKLAMKE